MIQATVRDLLLGKLDHIDLSGVYVVRDGEHALYVGRSVDVVHRLHDHYEKWSSSPIGDVIRINAPQSYDWQLELLTPEECRPFLPAKYTLYDDPTIAIGIGTAEVSVIMRYHPCLNTSNNPTPNRLPEHIKRYPGGDELEAGLTDNLY